jgi:hypothetical protein
MGQTILDASRGFGKEQDAAPPDMPPPDMEGGGEEDEGEGDGDEEEDEEEEEEGEEEEDEGEELGFSREDPIDVFLDEVLPTDDTHEDLVKSFEEHEINEVENLIEYLEKGEVNIHSLAPSHIHSRPLTSTRTLSHPLAPSHIHSHPLTSTRVRTRTQLYSF